MEGCVKFPLAKNQLSRLTEQAKDYLATAGLVLRTPEAPLDATRVTLAPVTLFPSPVPRKLYTQAQDVQNHINLLMFRIATDHSFLKQSLEQVIKVDEFTRRVWQIYDTVTQEGLSQPYDLGLLRSDYMFNSDIPEEEVLASGKSIDPKTASLRQIEVNTIAASFGGLCQRLETFHRFTLQRMKKTAQTNQIAVNHAVDVLAKGFVKAWELYDNPESVILFLVEAGEKNIFDQRLLEYAVYNINPEIEVIRRTMVDMREKARLTDDKELFVGDLEVSVIYQRTLYAPQDYKCEEDWSLRLLMERSRAIKCPSAGLQLAGTKKVQQILTKAGVMERFISPEAAAQIRLTFADQYSLDLDEEGDRAVQMALATPHRFVLKPQREGGGNNTFGEEICKVLKELGTTKERTAYILMEMIHPAPVHNYMLRSGQPSDTLYHCVSELGIFGAFIGSQEKNSGILNVSGGHILRTKTVGTDEGGTMTGFSCLDSPFLVD